MTKSKRIFMKLSIPAAAIVLLIIPLGCKHDDDTSERTKEINRFIKETMDFVYLWNTDMPILDPNKQPDPKAFFYNLLNDTDDRWSYITDEYSSLAASLSGVEFSMGYSFELKLFNNKVVGFVEYVEKDSPADKANIKRGDILYKIDGQEMNVDNYYDLLNKQSYTLTLGSIVSTSEIISSLPSIKLTAKILDINPIFKDTIYEIEGKKIGYLIYNSFVDKYKDQLTEVFERFKMENLTDLILDLRYNSGGSVSVAKYLASTIGPSYIMGQTMFKSTYNASLTDFYLKEYPNDTEIFEERFDTVQSNLNLNRLIVLTTRNSASASEMIIYSLKPYMDVIQIGATTPGKYYASIVIPEPREEKEWAIMPLIMKTQNSNSTIDYTQGQVPLHIMADDYTHELGDMDENLLAKAISIITSSGYQGTMDLKSPILSEQGPFLRSKENLNPIKFRMLIDNILTK
ncbi:MAG: S41 family peptidase [Breznakibacter sp.]